MRASISLLIVLALAFTGCSSSDDNDKDSGPKPDTIVEEDKGVEQDKGVEEDKGVEQEAAESFGFELKLEIWEMNEVAGGKNMFDFHQKQGEEQSGLTFETIDGAGDGGIIANDAGWIAYAYRGPYIMYITTNNVDDMDQLKADTIALIKHLAGKLPATSSGDKVETYVPADGEVAGWVEDPDKPAGVEAGYNDSDIEDIINGHHAPFAEEGTKGFAKQDYMK